MARDITFKARHRITTFKANNMIIDNVLVKDSGETITIGVDFTNREPILSGSTLSSATITAIEVESETDYTSDLLSSGTASISSNVASGILQNGESGRDYKVSFACTFSNSDIYIEDVLVKVRDN